MKPPDEGLSPALLDQALSFALDLVREAEAPILSRFQRPLEVVRKRDNTPVTIADQEVEQLIRRRVGETFPEHGVIGEEFGETNAGARLTWVVDPIDGTKAFIHGVPLFGTLLALLHDREPVLGIIHMPALRETVHAVRGRGAYHNGTPCRVSAVSDMGDALILDGSPTTMERLGHGDGYRALRKKAGLHRGWGDCYGHLLVACGRAEAMIDPIVSVWDVAPLKVILEEAGGRFTSLDGEATIHAGTGVSTNALLHDSVLSHFVKSGEGTGG